MEAPIEVGGQNNVRAYIQTTDIKYDEERERLN